MKPKDFTLETFEAALKQPNIPVIVNFWATWSTACLMNQSRIDETASQCGNQAIVGYVDIDEIEGLAERFSIITLPTTLIFYNGQIAKQYMGIQEPDTLYDAVQELNGTTKKEAEEKPKEKKILNSPYN